MWWLVDLGVVVAAIAIFVVARRGWTKRPAVPYAPSLAEIEETDAKLRMIGGLPPRDAPKPKKPAARRPAEADELP